MVTFFDGEGAAAAAAALNGTSIKHKRFANFTSDCLEVNVEEEKTKKQNTIIQVRTGDLPHVKRT